MLLSPVQDLLSSRQIHFMISVPDIIEDHFFMTIVNLEPFHSGSGDIEVEVYDDYSNRKGEEVTKQRVNKRIKQ